MKISQRKPHNIVKKMTLTLGTQMLLFLISILLCDYLFWYDAVNLPSECIEQGKEKVVEASDKTFPFLLSYGPYQKTKRGYYLMVLHYNVDRTGSIYQVYTDINAEVMKEGELAPTHHYICAIARNPNVPIQMLVNYGGEGYIQLYYIGIYPIWLLVFAGLFVIGIIVYLLVRENWTRQVFFFLRGINTILFIGTIYYADCTANAVKENWQFIMLVFMGIVISISNIFGEIGKRECLFLSALAEICFIEWRNIINYEYDFMSFYLTTLISLGFLMFIYVFVKGKHLYPVWISAATTVFSLYSIGQYMYYCYFNDFFTIKIIRLLFTAVEATTSIQELITEEVVLQLCSLVQYFFILLMAYALMPHIKLHERILKIKQRVCNAKRS